MTNENWQQVKQIFIVAMRQPPEERFRFVERACSHDPELRREVESLLSSYNDAESFLEIPAVLEFGNTIETEEEKLQEGELFGHYEIVRQIGSGGMSDVYLARDTMLERFVAVKILNERYDHQNSKLRRFVREARAASALNHPSILVIHEIGESKKKHYIVSEFVEGGTLRDILNKEKLRLAEILDIAVQIAGALSAAHAAHIVHRDIKPENIIVRPDGYVKILDFGLAKLVNKQNELAMLNQEETTKGVILGTVSYMSPEQAKGKDIDERTDVFSFGAVLYEMIAGRSPFAAESATDTLADLLSSEPEKLSRLSPNTPSELERIIFKMLRKNRNDRYQSMANVLADLKDLRERLAVNRRIKKALIETETETKKFSVSDAARIDSRSIEHHSGQTSATRGAVVIVLLTIAFLLLIFGVWYLANFVI